MGTTIITDTYRFVNRLVEAGMPSAQAEALKDELVQGVGELVTKEHLDLRLVRLELKLYSAIVVQTGLVLGVMAKGFGWL